MSCKIIHFNGKMANDTLVATTNRRRSELKMVLVMIIGAFESHKVHILHTCKIPFLGKGECYNLKFAIIKFLSIYS